MQKKQTNKKKDGGEFTQCIDEPDYIEIEILLSVVRFY